MIATLESFARKFERAFEWRWLPHLLLAFACLMRILWIAFTPELTRSGALEESLLQLTAARNWSQFGYLYTLFLPDYVMSAAREQHPVVYTHFPALSALIPSLLQQLGLSVKMIRLVFSAISVAGLFYMFRFLQAACDRTVAIFGLLFSLFFVDPLFIWHDHFDYSFNYLLLFLPAYWLYTRRSLIGVGLVVFVASLLNYKIAITQITWLVLLSAYQDRRRLPKLLVICGGFAGLGIATHVLQNMAYLGSDIALQEILLTLKNRITGTPTTAELSAWYRDHNMVLWGAPRGLTSHDWLTSLEAPLHAQFKIFARYVKWYVLLATAIALIYGGQRITRRQFGFAVALLIVAGSWGLLFPAHSLGYGDVGMDSLAPLILLSLLMAMLMRAMKTARQPVRLLIFLAVFVTLTNSTEHLRRRYTHILYEERSENAYGTLAKLAELKGQPIWTNMTSVYVEFFVNQVVPGRCTIRAVIEKDLTGCHNLILNSRADLSPLRDFKYLVFSNEFLSGNMEDGSPEQLVKFEQMLKMSFDLVEENHFFKIFRAK